MATDVCLPAATVPDVCEQLSHAMFSAICQLMVACPPFLMSMLRLVSVSPKSSNSGLTVSADPARRSTKSSGVFCPAATVVGLLSAT